MTSPGPANKPVVHVRDSFGNSFHKIQNLIRERAYHLFQNRDFLDGDSISDWLQARSEVLSDIDLQLKDQKKNIVVEGGLTGYAPEEIEVEVFDGELRVSGSHKETSTDQKDGETESISQRRYFYRSFPLPAAVDEDRIQVKSSRDGTLKLILPKKSLASAKSVSKKSRVAPSKSKKSATGIKARMATTKATGATKKARPVAKKSTQRREQSAG
jgi:HSP20 family molecular chaperone IbpA